MKNGHEYKTLTVWVVTATVYLLLAFLTCSCAPALASPVRILTSNDRKTISRLCMELVRYDVSSFTKGQVSNAALIEFGVFYNCNDHPEHCLLSDADRGTGRVAAQYVSQAASKLFGKSIRHESTRNFRYTDNYYYFSTAKRPAPPQECQARRAVRQSGDKFSVKTDWLDPNSHRPCATGPELIVEKMTHNGTAHFVVIGYNDGSDQIGALSPQRLSVARKAVLTQVCRVAQRQN